MEVEAAEDAACHVRHQVGHLAGSQVEHAEVAAEAAAAVDEVGVEMARVVGQSLDEQELVEGDQPVVGRKLGVIDRSRELSPADIGFGGMPRAEGRKERQKRGEHVLHHRELVEGVIQDVGTVGKTGETKWTSVGRPTACTL